jgi:hypothetical protein
MHVLANFIWAFVIMVRVRKVDIPAAFVAPNLRRLERMG